MKNDKIDSVSAQTSANVYDDGNIPDIDLPQNKNSSNSDYENVEPLPESSRPRKDGPGGN